MLPALDQTIPVAQMVRFATVNDGGRATGMKFAGQGFPPRNVASTKHHLFDANRVITFYFDNRPISTEDPISSLRCCYDLG
jgi:hypothetical protein